MSIAPCMKHRRRSINPTRLKMLLLESSEIDLGRDMYAAKDDFRSYPKRTHTHTTHICKDIRRAAPLCSESVCLDVWVVWSNPVHAHWKLMNWKIPSSLYLVEIMSFCSAKQTFGAFCTFGLVCVRPYLRLCHLIEKSFCVESCAAATGAHITPHALLFSPKVRITQRTDQIIGYVLHTYKARVLAELFHPSVCVCVLFVSGCVFKTNHERRTNWQILTQLSADITSTALRACDAKAENCA